MPALRTTPDGSIITQAQRRQRDGRNRQAWRRFSKQILAAADGRCQLQLPGCTGTAQHAHRIGGGYHDLDSTRYRAACIACHATLHNKRGGG